MLNNPVKKKTYFISDLHLGADARFTSKEREIQVVEWLDYVAPSADAIYLVGDIFEFWFDYHRAIPRGFSRFFGKIAELRDNNIPIFFFTGNHDMWMFTYMEEEFGIPIIRKPMELMIKDKKILIGHGDGLGPHDIGYKILKRIFANKICQWLFARIHPNFGIGLAYLWSGKSRDSKYLSGKEWLGSDKEWLVSYCERKIKENPTIDYFLFGHRHLPIDYTLTNKKSKYINIGDWLNHNSYGVFDGNEIKIEFFKNEPVFFKYN